MDKKRKADRDFVRIELTKPQREELKEATGKDAEAIELSVNELEERIAPRAIFDT
ncbi:MAG TPA: hypothetical protein VNS52_11150 [Gemmatimonadaceae bacterium]|jgi:hypothetical protein|nr:hypothetical protein [Gemmatimonadaceae bacterium]